MASHLPVSASLGAGMFAEQSVWYHEFWDLNSSPHDCETSAPNYWAISPVPLSLLSSPVPPFALDSSPLAFSKTWPSYLFSPILGYPLDTFYSVTTQPAKQPHALFLSIVRKFVIELGKFFTTELCLQPYLFVYLWEREKSVPWLVCRSRWERLIVGSFSLRCSAPGSELRLSAWWQMTSSAEPSHPQPFKSINQPTNQSLYLPSSLPFFLCSLPPSFSLPFPPPLETGSY